MHMATKPQTDSVTRKRVRWDSEQMDNQVPLIWTRGSWMLIPMERRDGGRGGGGRDEETV